MKHTMLMWRKPSPEPLQDKIAATFIALSSFANEGELMKPRYLTANRKSAVRELEWSLDKFSEKLLENPVNNSNSSLGELGYSISLFSSLDRSKGISYRITVGNQNPLFFDVVAVSFPMNFFQSNPQALDIIPSLFKKSVKAFSPFWACITENSFLKKYDKYFLDGRPASVQWINYWSDSLFEPLGKEYAKNELLKFNINLEEGIFIIQPEPMDLANTETAVFCAKINEALALPRLY